MSLNKSVDNLFKYGKNINCLDTENKKTEIPYNMDFCADFLINDDILKLPIKINF